MATWAEMVAEIYERTKRPDLVSETAQHLKLATRTAHKSGKYWRDLTTVTVSSLPLDQVQEITLSTAAPRMRAVASIYSAANNKLEYKPITAAELLDEDGYLRVNVYWGFGSVIRLRAAAPEASVLLSYYQYPVVAPEASYSSWIAEEHSDLLVNLASSSLLASVGEQEIARRIDSLIVLQLADLQQDNLEIVGR